MHKKLLYITCDSWWDTDKTIVDGLKEVFDVNIFVSSLKNRKKNKYPIKTVPDGVSLHNEYYETTKWNPLMILASLKYFFKLYPYFKNRYIFYVLDANPYLTILLLFLLPSKKTIISFHNYIAHSDDHLWEKNIINLFLKKFSFFHFQSDIQETYFKNDYPLKISFSTKMPIKNFGLASNFIKIKKLSNSY